MIETEMMVVNEEGRVSARELHEKLGIKSMFRVWIKRMIEYGFAEGTDYTRALQTCNTLGGVQEVADYMLSLDTAKHICMLQRTPEGKRIRQYLIDLEKAWNTPEQIMARALKMADRTINSLKVECRELKAENEQLKPRADFANKLIGSKDCILIGELAKLLKQNGVETGQNRLFEWMRDNGYLIKQRGDSYNLPTQRAIEMGLFKIKKNVLTRLDGSIKVTATPKVTGKGQEYFFNKLTNI
jgi:anti-repressor protein